MIQKVLFSVFIVCMFGMFSGESRAFERQYNAAGQAFSEGRYEQAVQVLEDVLSDHPQAAEAHLLLGHSYHELEHWTQARAAYGRAMELGRLDTAMLARLSRIDERNGHSVAAMTALNLLLLISPEQMDVMLATAQKYINLGFDEPAERLYQQAVTMQPSKADGYLRLANQRLRREQWADAVIPLTAAYYLEQNNPDQAQRIGDVCLRADQPQAAAQWYRRAIDDGLDTGDLYLKLAQAHFRSGLDDKAKAAAQHAAELSDADTAGRAYLLLGQLAQDQADVQQAAVYWQKAAEHLELPTQIQLYLGTFAYRQHDYALAAKHLQAAYDTGDNSQSTFRLLISSYLHSQSLDDAREMMHQYIEYNGIDALITELLEHAVWEISD